MSGMNMHHHQLYKNLDDCYPSTNCKVTLKNVDLWKKFHELDTEMIITKSGRRMFPSLHIQIYDLDPLAHYCILLEMNPATHCRYKYSSSGGWAPAGTEEAQSPQRIYLHPDSPSTGEYWMSQPISFGRLKLTNTPSPPVGHMVLSSMHKYQPRIIITKTSHPRAIAWAPSSSVVFPETQFIAVTAYQNEKITKLKIDNNPFAKGFRENGQSKCKRKRTESEPVEDEKCSKQLKVEPSIKALPPLRVEDDRLSPCSISSPPSSPETSNRQSKYASGSPQYYSSYFYNHLFPQPTPAMYSYYPPYQFCSMWGEYLTLSFINTLFLLQIQRKIYLCHKNRLKRNLEN